MKKQLWRKRMCNKCGEVYVTTARTSKFCPMCQGRNCMRGCYMSIEDWQKSKNHINNMIEGNFLYTKCLGCGKRIKSHVGYCYYCNLKNKEKNKNNKDLNLFIENIRTIKQLRKSNEKIVVI